MWGILRQFVAFNEHSKEDERATSVDKAPLSSSHRLRRNAEKNGTVPDERKGGGSPAKTTAAPPATTTKKASSVNAMKNRIYTSQIAYPTVNGAPAVNHGGRIL